MVIVELKNLSSSIFENQSELVSEFDYLYVSNIEDCIQNSVFWLKKLENYILFDQCFLVISKSDYDILTQTNQINKSIYHLVCNKNLNPRLSFSILLNECVQNKNKFDDTEKHKKNSKIKIFGQVYIFNDVQIGDGTIIYPNVVIHENVKIGKNCIIRDNSSLGTTGMGFEKDLDGNWYHLPQVGGVVIGDNVEIGSHSDIKKGTINNTIIGNYSKLGSYTNIGHNCVIGENSLFTNHCVVAGSTIVGKNFFMGICSSVGNGLTIGDNVTVAANVFVNENVSDNKLTFGVNKKNS